VAVVVVLVDEAEATEPIVAIVAISADEDVVANVAVAVIVPVVAVVAVMLRPSLSTMRALSPALVESRPLKVPFQPAPCTRPQHFSFKQHPPTPTLY
jgi:hypothetical protein